MTQDPLKEDAANQEALYCLEDPQALTPEERKKASLRAAITGLLINLVLAAAKLIAGALSG
ncbi:MAG: hypothetical protein GX853_10500, partial [Chloroflexi bacterium]|nr:hypothetical protein [Chloroflexota bacterium]